jgi:hypothetical protein
VTDIVEKVGSSQWMKDGVETTTYWVTLVDGVGQREIPCYDPRGKDLKEDSPLPEGWEVKTSKAGKPYLAAPRNAPGGGRRDSLAAAWRNTEAGAKYEQERMDRRTALMQAVTLHGELGNGWNGVETTASMMFAWLRESVGAEVPSTSYREPSAAAGTMKGNSASSRQVPTSAPTPSDEGGEQSNSPTHREAAPPSSTSSDGCHCGQPWGPNTTASGKHVCLAGHVERLG